MGFKECVFRKEKPYFKIFAHIYMKKSNMTSFSRETVETFHYCVFAHSFCSDAPKQRNMPKDTWTGFF